MFHKFNLYTVLSQPSAMEKYSPRYKKYTAKLSMISEQIYLTNSARAKVIMAFGVEIYSLRCKKYGSSTYNVKLFIELEISRYVFHKLNSVCHGFYNGNVLIQVHPMYRVKLPMVREMNTR